MSTATPAHTNRLARETSPYLLQHQHNPVDWYPWGPEAFERARREDKPIFLSVGYSTCYWCHVMERQSFENEAIARVMNELFVNIKVDREERPDVDQLYMTAVTVLTRHGGWPMSVWLTPDLRPFYGGTYYPPTDAHGRPGFVTVCNAIADAYRDRHDEVERSASQLTNILQQVAEPGPPAKPVTVDMALVSEVIERSTDDYDATNGGFGGAPKFPRETLLELLLVYCRDQPDEYAVRQGAQQAKKARLRGMALHTLDALADGGIRDHLGGGFHRYSTDAEWLVPHFEIMLYDNAMLAWCYVEAYRQTEEPRYAQVARGIFDFVLREMTSPAGAFHTAFDAEVDGQEGLNYLWTPAQVEAVLGADDAKLFNRVYGLDRGFNFADPHHGTGTPDKNILFLPEPLAAVAVNSRFASVADLDARLAPMRAKLLAARAGRKQPLLDTKILTSWNALMIRAFAYGGHILGEPRYGAAAERAATFLLQHHRDHATGGLFRTSRDGAAKYDAFLDDYAFLAQALLAIVDGGGDRTRWTDAAARVALAMIERFGDDAGGGFYFSAAGATDLVVRQKVSSDSPLPSGNAVAAVALQHLGQDRQARGVIAAFAEQMVRVGEGMSAMVQAALLYLLANEPFVASAGGGAAAGAGGATAAAARPPTPAEVAGEVVQLSAVWAKPDEMHLTIDVLDPWHVNAHEPAPGLIATQVSIVGGDDTAVAAIDYPPGEMRRLAFADQELRVYDGKVTVAVRFARIGSKPLRVGVQYQACNDDACLPPVTKQIDVVPPIRTDVT